MRKEGRNIENGTVIAFTGRVRLNAAFAAVLRENNVVLDEAKLFDGSNYESGTPETSAVFAAITDRAANAFPDFEIERHIILGCFMDPASQMLVESQKIIDQLAQGPTGNTALDALAGDRAAAEALEGAEIPEYSPFDADPHGEYEVAISTIPSDTLRSLRPRAIRCLWIARLPTIPPSRLPRSRPVA